MRHIAFGLAVSLFIGATAPALAGATAASIGNAGMPANCVPFATKVSASEGNWGTVNPYGCLGAFQFCPGTFERYYSGSASSFLNNPSAQVEAWTRYQQQEWRNAQNAGSTSLIGQQVCYRGQCATVDESAILMACQFGCGNRGKLANFARNGGQCVQGNKPGKLNGGSSPTNDGNGVCVAQYLIKGAGYDASCFTGKSPSCTPSTPDAPTTPAPADSSTIKVA